MQTLRLHQDAPTCSRCGAPVLDDRAVAAALEAALTAIDHAKLRWPVGITGEIRALAIAMRCRTGTCGDGSGR